MARADGPDYINHYRLLDASLDAIQDGICVLDADMNILRVNRFMKEWYEHALPLEGEKCYRVFQGREEPCENCPSVEVLRTGRPAAEKVPLTRGRDRENWVELNSFPLKNETGEVAGVVEFLRDITGEVEIRRALEESEEKYRALMEQSVDMIYLHDLDGSIIEVNRAAVDWTGYTREELCRMSIFDLHPEPHPAVGARKDITGQWRSWDPGSGAFNIQTMHRRRDGTVIPVSVNAGKVLIGDKELILALVRDRTEQLKAEEALQYQYRFERMIAEISSSFVNTSAEEIDRAIDHALAKSGQFFDADRCYLCRFSEDGRYMDNTHEWCAAGIPSIKERNQGFTLENAPWWAEQLRRGAQKIPALLGYPGPGGRR